MHSSGKMGHGGGYYVTYKGMFYFKNLRFCISVNTVRKEARVVTDPKVINRTQNNYYALNSVLNTPRTILKNV